MELNTKDIDTGEQIFIVLSVILGFLFTILGSIVLLSIVNGIVLSSLWNWFVVKQFGAARMSVPMAIGLNLILNLLIQKFSSTSTSQEKDKKKIAGQLIGILLSPLFVLFVGWIVQLYL